MFIQRKNDDGKVLIRNLEKPPFAFPERFERDEDQRLACREIEPLRTRLVPAALGSYAYLSAFPFDVARSRKRDYIRKHRMFGFWLK